MTKRSPEQVYALCIQAGFTPEAAKIMTAIAGPESGYDDANLGDLGLQNAEWGPSFGLFQIRTRKAETGRGSNRDQVWLAQSDLNQAKAAYAISSGGTNFAPWSTYNDGKYRAYLGAAGSAAATVGTNIQKWLAGIGGVLADGAGVAGSVATSATDAILTPLLEGGRKLGFTAGFAALGGLLVIIGAFVFAYPYAREKVDQGAELAVTAAKAVI